MTLLPNRSRKIIVSIAASADGYIARLDGSFDWLDRPDPPDHYGMDEFVRSIDTILWGRKTFDVARKIGSDAMFPGLRNCVFSRHPQEPCEGAEFIVEPPAQFSKSLRAIPGKDIWIMGGAEIVAAFLDAGEIDEFRVAVIPVFIGEGIPLIAPRQRHIELTLDSARPYPDGVVVLNYCLTSPAGSSRNPPPDPDSQDTRTES